MAAPTPPYDSNIPGIDLWSKLELTSHDPFRTAVVNVKTPQKELYKAKTDESGSNPVTTFTNEYGETIAIVEWHLYLSDKISVRGGKMESVGKWLENKKFHKGICSSFVDEHGSSYTWRSACNNGSLQLFEGDSSSDPIALLASPSPKTGDGQETKPVTIVLSDRAKKGHDEILLSALLLERSRWLSERNTSSPLDYLGMAISNFSV